MFLSVILHLVTPRQSPIEPGVRLGNSKLDLFTVLGLMAYLATSVFKWVLEA